MHVSLHLFSIIDLLIHFNSASIKWLKVIYTKFECNNTSNFECNKENKIDCNLFCSLKYVY